MTSDLPERVDLPEWNPRSPILDRAALDRAAWWALEGEDLLAKALPMIAHAHTCAALAQAWAMIAIGHQEPPSVAERAVYGPNDAQVPPDALDVPEWVNVRPTHLDAAGDDLERNGGTP